MTDLAGTLIGGGAIFDASAEVVVPGTVLLPPQPAAAPVDVTPPVVANQSPAPGTAIAADNPITFEVTDDSGAFARVIVSVTIAGVTEVVHDGTQFRGYYSSSSSRSMISGGWSYTVLRTGGWPSAPTFEVFAIDSSGNENS